MNFNLRAFAMSASVLTLSLASLPSEAVNANRTRTVFPSAACEPATFLVSQLRHRPNSFRNESSSGIYVTCSIPADSNATAVTSTGLKVQNTSGVTVNVTCSMTNMEDPNANSTTTYPQTIPLTAGAGTYISWNAGPYRQTSYSCLLQPGVEIGLIYQYFTEDVGS